MGRFICADSYASTGQGLLGANMFAYCGNNPINAIDPSGCTILNIMVYGPWITVESLVVYGPYIGTQTTLIGQGTALFYKPHAKKGTTTPSNRNKHQEGESRKKKDQLPRKLV